MLCCCVYLYKWLNETIEWQPQSSVSLSLPVFVYVFAGNARAHTHTYTRTHTVMAIFDPVIYACLAAAAQLIKLINELQQRINISIGLQMYLRDRYSSLLLLPSSSSPPFSSSCPGPTCLVVCVHNKAISWKIFLVVATAAAEKIKRSPRQPQMKRA